MYKGNDRLQRDVLDELRWDPAVEASAIGVSVIDGVVTLTGEVSGPGEREAVIRAAERVPGVRAIADEMAMRIPGSLLRSDVDVARDVASLLAAHDIADEVKARVEDGWLWLEGEVDWPYQRSIAERVVRQALTRIYGLRGVTNDIGITRPASPPAPVNRPRLLVR